MYRKTFYGYGKGSIEEAKKKIEKNYELEMKEIDQEIEKAIQEQKLMLDTLNGMIIDLKKSRESGWQIKQLKEYMPYIITQKKLTIQKETAETIKATEKYVSEINKHVDAIDGEIEKVKHRIQSFMNSVSQLLVFRNVKEYDDLIQRYDQLLDAYLPVNTEMVQAPAENLEMDDLFIEGMTVEQDDSVEQKVYDRQFFGQTDEQLDDHIQEELLVKMEETLEQVREEATPLIEKEIAIEEIDTHSIAVKETAVSLAILENTILFAEHDKDMAALLKHLFEREGFDVLYAADGREAYDMINSCQKPPQIVLLNMMLPYLDGYQLINHIRSLGDWSHVPIVTITSNQAEWDTVNILNAGANDVVRKPYSPREILARIRRLSLVNEKVI